MILYREKDLVPLPSNRRKLLKTMLTVLLSFLNIDFTSFFKVQSDLYIFVRMSVRPHNNTNSSPSF